MGGAVSFIQSVGSNVANDVGYAAHAVADTAMGKNQTVNNALNGDGSNNFFTGSSPNSLPSLASDVLRGGVGYSAGQNGNGFHQGMAAPAPTPVPQSTIDNTVNNSTSTYNNSTPPIEYPTQPIANPEANNPGYQQVGDVNGSNYNGAMPIQPAAAPATPVNASGLPTQDTSPSGNPVTTNNNSTKSSDANWQQWLAPGAIALGGAISAGGSIYAANTTSQAQKDAAQKIADATNTATGLQQQQNQIQQNNLQPWLAKGQIGLNNLADFVKNPPQFDYTSSPGYQWSLQQGLNAIQNSAAARGGLLSGNTMKAMNDYAQGAARGDYQNMHANWMGEQGMRLNANQSLAGEGQTAVRGANQASQNYASNAGQMGVTGAQAQAAGITGAANANASGWMGGGNALNQAISGGINYGQSQGIINALSKG